jgi:DNA mismatch endonuclease, patch repair protein
MNALRKEFDDVPPGRRRIMSAIRSTGSKPETDVRRTLHSLGYRFKKNVRGLPGKPDIVFTSRKKAVFVHGCFWHQHANCENGRMPRTRINYWKPKLARNVTNDERNIRLLAEAGWSAIVIWECDVRRDLRRTVESVARFLGPPRHVPRS